MNFHLKTKTSILVLIALTIYSILSVIINFPIFGSDEYAYFIRGIYLDNSEDLNTLDPYLQRISNILYFNLIHAWNNIFKFEFVYTYRLLHAIEYILAGLILHQTFYRIIGKKNAFWGMFIFLIYPSTIYIFAITPEIELILLASCLTYTLIKIFPESPRTASSIAGIILGMSILIKPHAVAMLIATITTIAIYPTFYSKKFNIKLTLQTVIVLLLFTYVSLILIWKICGNEWAFNPLITLGLDAYGDYINTENTTTNIVDKYLDTIHYIFAHIVVITLIFSPMVIWLISILLKKHKYTTDNTTNTYAIIAIYIMAMFAAHIVMTAWFTAGAGSNNIGEAMRIHGRYLGVILALLPFLYFHSINNLNQTERTMACILSGISLLACYLYFFEILKIFPWDYPLIFSFFNPVNHYKWNFSGSYSIIGNILPWLIFLLLISAIIFKKHQTKALYIQLFIIVFLGNIQTYNWLSSHSKLNRQLVNNAKTFGTLLGKNQFGKGVLVSNERFGRTSYILFGLANAPKVIIKKTNNFITEDDVKGANWVLFDKNYNADFDYLNSIKTGQLKLFFIKTNIEIKKRQKKRLQPGNKIELSLAQNKTFKSMLNGFNTQESWGAWTSEPKAIITIPLIAHGTIKLKIFSWTLLENINQPLKIRIGDAVSKVNLTETGMSYEFIMKISHQTDEIHLQSLVTHPSNSHRPMGVGISKITIESL